MVVGWMDILTFYLNHLSPLQGYFSIPESEEPASKKKVGIIYPVADSQRISKDYT